MKDDYVDVSKYVRKLSYDFKKQKKGNTLITGMNQVGKSRLAMLLASRLAENIYRIMSVGANQKIRVIAITPSMSLIDAFFIRLCGQRFHFRLSIEENSLRKFRRYYGNDYTRIVQSLECGYALHYLKGKLKVVKIPLFKRKALTSLLNIEKVLVQ